MKSTASKFCGGALAVMSALLGLAGQVFFAFLVLLIPVNVLAVGGGDTVDPSSYATSLKPGQSATISKTVTISAGTPISAKVDVFFLADTTGSMSTALSNVKNGAAAIMAGTSGLGDVAYGVGEYKDVGDAFVYRRNQDITTDTAAVQTGINAWGASGGGDTQRLNYMDLIRWPTPLPGEMVPPVSSSGLGMPQAMIPPRELPRPKPSTP